MVKKAWAEMLGWGFVVVDLVVVALVLMLVVGEYWTMNFGFGESRLSTHCMENLVRHFRSVRRSQERFWQVNARRVFLGSRLGVRAVSGLVVVVVVV